MRSVARLCAALLMGAGAYLSAPAVAQIAANYLERPSEDVLREAFSGDYGQLLIAELGKMLAASADRSCLAAKGLGPAQLTDGGEKLLVRYGGQMLDIFRATVDMAKFNAQFGASAKAELEKLSSDPEVAKLIGLELPGRRSRLVGVVVENFDRFVLLNRFKLPNLSPIATGNDTLMNADPAEKSEEAVDAFISKSQSPQVARFVALAEQSQQALEHAMDRSKVLLLGPTQMMRGADQALADLCVLRR